MKKLLFFILLFPLSGYASYETVTCDRAKELMQPTIAHGIITNPDGSITINYSSTFEIPFIRPPLAEGFSNYCDYEWKYDTPDVLTVTWRNDLLSNLYYIKNGTWVLYGQKSLSEYEYITKRQALITEAQQIEKNNIAKEQYRKTVEDMNKNINLAELKKAEEDAKRAIEAKLALMETGSTSTGNLIQSNIENKPLSLKEKRLLKIKENKEKRLARLKALKEARVLKVKKSN